MSSDDLAALTPALHWQRAPENPSVVVLVLHGGKVRSIAPAETHQLSAVRMRPFARRVSADLPDAAVVTLQYRMRGWNGADRSPVADARWALGQIRARFGDDVAVILLGHSMGGRTAAAVADDPSVRAIMALAPWWPAGDETATMRPGQRLVVVHGTMDRWTSASLSRTATERAARRGVDATWTSMLFAGHFMLMRPWVWNRRVVRTVHDMAARYASPRTTSSRSTADARAGKENSR